MVNQVHPNWRLKMITFIPRGPDPRSCNIARRDAIHVWGEYSPAILIEIASLSIFKLHRLLPSCQNPVKFWNLN
jgi:hypothetical protein